jgi:hypothetical protein
VDRFSEFPFHKKHPAFVVAALNHDIGNGLKLMVVYIAEIGDFSQKFQPVCHAFHL